MLGKIFINDNYKHIQDRKHTTEGINKGNIRRTIRNTNTIAWERQGQYAVVNENTNQIVIFEYTKNKDIKVITSYFSTKNQIANRIKKYNIDTSFLNKEYKIDTEISELDFTKLNLLTKETNKLINESVTYPLEIFDELEIIEFINFCLNIFGDDFYFEVAPGLSEEQKYVNFK